MSSGAVLIVDDSLTVRMDLVDAFEEAGFTAIPCATGAEARAALAGGAVDAVILDVILPDTDGIELLREIRARPDGDALPVLMLSTEAEVKDRVLGLRTGADEYVGKPYDVRYLVAKVRALTGARAAPAPAGAEPILVIDDSVTFREALRQAFEGAGHLVVIAGSGEEGLRLAAARRPGAIVVDGMLPGIDGATVIRRVRLDAALRDIPCLLLTASEDKGAELRALDAGADAFVRKEEEVEVILAKLAAILRRSAPRPIEETASLLGPKKILAVDDSPTYLDALAGTLRAEGHEVILARSGEEAIELLAIQTVDCILLDLLMPGLGGHETCRRIKAAPATRDVPLVVLTALEDREAMIQGLGAGADDYIQKSGDIETLQARVRAQLRRKQFEDENRRFREELLRKELEAAEARGARELAETRAALVEELERRVDERTAELGHANRALKEEVEERRRAEQALRESEQSLATTLDSIGDAVIATDIEGRIVRMNPVAEQLTGWPRGDARGRPLGEVFRIHDERTRRPVEDPAVQVLREGGVVGLASGTTLTARDGSQRPIAESGAPIRDPQGRTHGVVLVFRDQTEERRMVEIRRKSGELETQNRRIQEANRLKSEFLANMSHELRTPLNAIIGFAELIFHGDVKADSPQHQEFMGDILTSSRHLLQLINDVLDLSKVEAGKVQFYPEPVNLSKLVDEVLGILRTIVASKSIRIEAQVDPSLTGIVLDASRMKQVLYNYVSNALKFTGEGGRVTIRMMPDLLPAAFRLEVEDTGIGIDPREADRLFVEFEQLDAGAAKRHSGTGLGLALTKKLVEAQGGSVGVSSVLGVGSTFHAIFPRQAIAGAPMAARRSLAGADPDAPAVLVVEDDEREQALVVRTLAEAGFAVETASTGAQALSACRERTFAAITLDLLLPDMSGLDVLRAIRAEGDNRDVPVVIATVAAEHGVTAGFAVQDFLTKPFDGAALLASLRRAGLPPEKSGTVLAIDDDPGSRRLIAATLGQLGYRAEVAESGEAGLRLARASAPAAVVLDLMMPEMDGFQFLEQFRLLPGCRSVPVVIWTVKDLSTEELARLRPLTRGILPKGHDGGAAVLDELRALLAKGGPAAGEGRA